MGKIKKVFLVVNTLTLGGAEAQALIMAREINKMNGYKPVIIGLVSGGPLVTILQKEAIEYIIIGVDFAKFNKNIVQKMGELYKVYSLLKKEKPYVIISSTYYPNLVMSLVSFLISQSRFFWYQVGKEWEMPFSKLQKLAQACTSNFLANSEDVKGYMVERLNIFPEKIQVIPNVFLERFAQTNKVFWYQKWQLNDDNFVFILISNFFRSKDQMSAVCAMKSIVHQYPNVRLILAGYPPEPHYLNSIKAKVIDEQLYNHVLFTESTPDVFGLLQIAHVGVFTSVKKHTEGSPTIIQEYMHAQLPTIVSDIPCNRETFEGIDEALFYEPENVSDLSEKMRYCVENKNMLSIIGQKNKARVDSMYNPTRLNEILKGIVK